MKTVGVSMSFHLEWLQIFHDKTWWGWDCPWARKRLNETVMGDAMDKGPCSNLDQKSERNSVSWGRMLTPQHSWERCSAQFSEKLKFQLDDYCVKKKKKEKPFVDFRTGVLKEPLFNTQNREAQVFLFLCWYLFHLWFGRLWNHWLEGKEETDNCTKNCIFLF